MLKKRIYLPEKCREEQCEAYKKLKEACQSCPIYLESMKERAVRTQNAHRKAASKYYNKKKDKKSEKPT